jgi:peroxiredoxin
MMLAVGDTAPDFSLQDQNNQTVRLSSFRSSKSVLLVFYPLAFTGTCGGELCSIRDNIADFVTADLQLLTVSVDSMYAHRVWADQENFTFPLLSDFWPHGSVAQSYGVLDTTRGYARRGTFLIDPTGTIRFTETLDPGRSRDQDGWRTAIAALRSPLG